MTDISFTDREVALSSGALLVRTAGTGRPLIHLHSGAGPRVSGVVEALADHHLVHAPVMPGFDGTLKHPSATSIAALADLVGEFINKDCDGEADIVGEGLGGWIALWVALRHPGLIGQMVLEAPAGLRRSELIARPDSEDERLQLLHAVAANVPETTRSAQCLEDNRRALQDYTQGIDFDEALAARLGEINTRTLILMGALDKIVPRETGHVLKAGLPRSHLTYIWGAAHAIEFDQPQRTSTIVLDFLDRGESFLVRQAAPAA